MAGWRSWAGRVERPRSEGDNARTEGGVGPESRNDNMPVLDCTAGRANRALIRGKHIRARANAVAPLHSNAGREAPDSDHAKLAGADFGKHGGYRRVDRRNIIGFPDRLFWPVLIVRMTDYASSESAPCSKNRSLPSSSRLLSTSAVFSLISFSIICVIVHPK